MRRLALVLVPSLVLAGLVVATPAAVAQHPGANGVITSVEGFVWSEVTRPDGTERACCGPYPEEGSGHLAIATEEAIWGPDGRTVAVVGEWPRDGAPAGPEIFVYDLVSDTIRLIGPADDSRPDFSPDGSELVITRGGDLVVLDVALGEAVRQLTSTPGMAEVDPSWSADGTTIAFVTPAGVSVVPAAGGPSDLLVPGAIEPQYSGDGEHLAYLLGSELWLSDTDGTDAIDTTVRGTQYTWSPDSTRFAVVVDQTLLGEPWQSAETWVTTVDGHQVSPNPGGGSASASSWSWQPVQAPEPVVVAPTASVSGAASSFAGSTTVTVRWAASDLVSPVVSTDVRYRRASALGGAFTSYRWWLNGSTARRATLDAVPGHRYCFSTRARNAAGAVSAWSAEKCTTVPLDDRQLAASGGWTRIAREGFLRGTASRTTQRWASLTSARGYVREVGVIASTGPNGGAVAVLVGSRRIGTISLVSAIRRDRALIMLPRLAQGRYGVIRLVVLTSGKTVRIDALAASAR